MQYIHWSMVVLAFVVWLYIFLHKHNAYNTAIINKMELPFNHNYMTATFLALFVACVVALVAEIRFQANLDPNKLLTQHVNDVTWENVHVLTVVCCGIALVGALCGASVFSRKT